MKKFCGVWREKHRHFVRVEFLEVTIKKPDG